MLFAPGCSGLGMPVSRCNAHSRMCKATLVYLPGLLGLLVSLGLPGVATLYVDHVTQQL